MGRRMRCAADEETAMTMQIRETKQFAFSMPVEDINYAFNISAATRTEAVNKLSTALKTILDELQAMEKVRAN